jgi:glutathione S-transferase
MAAHEKDISYELVPVGGAENVGSTGPLNPLSDSHLARHPFGRIPAMVHGDVALFESVAIAQYFDDAFRSGRRLQPQDPGERGHMTQWVSAALDYIAPACNRDFTLKFVFAGPEGPDPQVIADGLAKVRSYCEILDRALYGRSFLAGEGLAPTLADLLLAPPLFYVQLMPGGGQIFDDLASLSAWWSRMSERDSFAKTHPPIADQLTS